MLNVLKGVVKVTMMTKMGVDLINKGINGMND